MSSQGQLQTPTGLVPQHHPCLHLALPLPLCGWNFYNYETQLKNTVTFSPITFLQVEKDAFLNDLRDLHREHRRKRVMGRLLGF